MTTTESAVLRADRAPLAGLRSFPALFEAYCTRYPEVAPFFAGDPRDPAALRAAADRAAAHPRDRAALVEVLLDQNERWGMDEAVRASVERLRDPEAVAVVTGQQVGLFGGPLYTVYKALTAVQLAERLAADTGRPVVPVFWLEGEDHDFAEIAEVALMHNNEVVRLRYEGPEAPEGGNLGPVGRLPLSPAVGELLDRLDESLAPSDFKDELLERVRAAYQPGTTLLDAFARLLQSFFPGAGLVMVDPGDPRLKRMAAPLFRREIEEHAEVERRLRAVSERVAERFHAQLQPRPLNLFLVGETGRLPLDARDGAVVLRGTDRSFGRDELLAVLDEEPARFSPNVVLRPLVQDLLLPTAAYVGGPGEVSYFAQLGPVYEWAGVPMPVIYPRASVSLLEPKVHRVLDRYRIPPAELAGDLEPLFRRVLLGEMEVDVEGAFARAEARIEEALEALKPVVETVDPTHSRSVDGTRGALLKEVGRLRERVIRAEKQRHDQMRGQLEKARTNLFPEDGLQERSLSILYFANKYGPELLGRLRQTVSLDTSEHQLVYL